MGHRSSFGRLSRNTVVGQLGGMRAVVAADAEQAAQRLGQRRAQRDGVDRQARAATRRQRLAARQRLDQRQRAARRHRPPPAAWLRGRQADTVPTWSRPPQLQLAMRIEPCLRWTLLARLRGPGGCGLTIALLRLVSQIGMDASYGPAPPQDKNNHARFIPGITRMARLKHRLSEAPVAARARRQGGDLQPAARYRDGADPQRRPHPVGGRSGGCARRCRAPPRTATSPAAAR